MFFFLLLLLFLFFFFFRTVFGINEPAHEIMILFFHCRLIVQMRMRSHPVGLDG